MPTIPRNMNSYRNIAPEARPAVMLVLLPQIEVFWVGLGYLVVFGVGTIASMALINDRPGCTVRAHDARSAVAAGDRRCSGRSEPRVWRGAHGRDSDRRGYHPVLRTPLL